MYFLSFFAGTIYLAHCYEWNNDNIAAYIITTQAIIFFSSIPLVYWSLPLKFTTEVYHWSLPLKFTTVYSKSTDMKSTISNEQETTHCLVTTSCSQLLMIGFHIICKFTPFVLKISAQGEGYQTCDTHTSTYMHRCGKLPINPSNEDRHFNKACGTFSSFTLWFGGIRIQPTFARVRVVRGD